MKAKKQMLFILFSNDYERFINGSYKHDKKLMKEKGKTKPQAYVKISLDKIENILQEQ